MNTLNEKLNTQLITNVKRRYFPLLSKISPLHQKGAWYHGRIGRHFDDVIGVNRKNGDAIHRRSSFRDKRGHFWKLCQAADRFTRGIARVYIVLSCSEPFRHLQRFLHVQEAAWRVPLQGEGLGAPIQTQVAFVKKTFLNYNLLRAWLKLGPFMLDGLDVSSMFGLRTVRAR